MNIFFKHLIEQKVKAFTLLEVLASLSIVTLVILGPLSSSVNSASFARQTKDVMTSTYLAEEALELLHYQYDSLYLACANDRDACSSLFVPTLDGETSGGKAWRLFKKRLQNSNLLDGTVSCFDVNGCSYDFLDMRNATNITDPKKYSPTGNYCPKLSLVRSAVIGTVDGIRNYYVCSGITMADYSSLVDTPLSIKKTAYSRKVFVESKVTFNEGVTSTAPANLELYHDDLLITATVSFRRANGVVRNIKVVDFLHARS